MRVPTCFGKQDKRLRIRVATGQEPQHRVVAALGESLVGTADGEERERLARAHDLIRNLAEFADDGGRRNRDGEDDDVGPRLAHRSHRRPRRVARGGTVVAHDHGPACCALTAPAQEEILLAREFGSRALAHGFERLFGEARGEELANEGRIQVRASLPVARCDRTEGNLLMPRDSQLPGWDDVERQPEASGEFGRDGDAAAAQPDDEGSRAGGGAGDVLERRGQHASRVCTVQVEAGALICCSSRLGRGHDVSVGMLLAAARWVSVGLREVIGMNRGGDELRKKLERAAELRAAGAAENDPELAAEEELRKKRLKFDSAARADYLVRDAMARGEFDDLKYAGKPIPGLGGTYDPDWWIKGLIQREHLTGLGPKALLLRVEDAEMDQRLDVLFTEREVRAAVEDFNARVIDARRQLEGGPPVVTKTRDVDDEVRRWRERRDARTAASGAEEPAEQKPRTWWRRLWRGQS